MGAGAGKGLDFGLTKGSQRIKLNIQLFANFPKDKSQISHIFRNKEGHISDNSFNRKKIIQLVENENNFVGVGENGTKWYYKMTAEGQLWASVYNGVIRNCGLNKNPLEYVKGKGIKKTIVRSRRKKNE